MIFKTGKSQRINCNTPIFTKIEMNKYLIYSNDMITIKIPNRQKLEMNYILPNILINFEHPEEQDIDYVQEILNRIDFSSTS